MPFSFFLSYLTFLPINRLCFHFKVWCLRNYYNLLLFVLAIGLAINLAINLAVNLVVKVALWDHEIS